MKDKVVLQLKGYPTSYGGVDEFITFDGQHLYYVATGRDDFGNIINDKVPLKYDAKSRMFYVDDDYFQISLDVIPTKIVETLKRNGIINDV